MQQKKFVWAFLLCIGVSATSIGKNIDCMKITTRLSAGALPIISTERKPSPVLDAMPGNAETGLALALYQRLKDPNDGHLDIFVPVRSFPIDRPPDINHLYSAIAFFGVDRGLPLRDRSGQGMKRNPEAKRPIRIFPVASPAEAMPTPEEFLAAAKEFAIEFDTPVMIPTECANAFHIRQLTWEMFVPRRLN